MLPACPVGMAVSCPVRRSAVMSESALTTRCASAVSTFADAAAFSDRRRAAVTTAATTTERDPRLGSAGHRGAGVPSP